MHGLCASSKLFNTPHLGVVKSTASTSILEKRLLQYLFLWYTFTVFFFFYDSFNARSYNNTNDTELPNIYICLSTKDASFKRTLGICTSICFK